MRRVRHPIWRSRRTAADDEPEEPETVPEEPDEDEEPVVPPGIAEDQLPEQDEPDDYDPEE